MNKRIRVAGEIRSGREVLDLELPLSAEMPRNVDGQVPGVVVLNTQLSERDAFVETTDEIEETLTRHGQREVQKVWTRILLRGEVPLWQVDEAFERVGLKEGRATCVSTRIFDGRGT